MADYHTIRLHGPWQADFFSSLPQQSAGLPDSESAGVRQRIKLPLVDQAWVEPEFTGSIELNRNFNWPHNDVQAVYLQIVSNLRWAVWVNDHLVHPLHGDHPTSLVDLLKPQNQLRLQTEVSAGFQPTMQEVSLQVR